MFTYPHQRPSYQTECHVEMLRRCSCFSMDNIKSINRKSENYSFQPCSITSWFIFLYSVQHNLSYSGTDPQQSNAMTFIAMIALSEIIARNHNLLKQAIDNRAYTQLVRWTGNDTTADKHIEKTISLELSDKKEFLKLRENWRPFQTSSLPW